MILDQGKRISLAFPQVEDNVFLWNASKYFAPEFCPCQSKLHLRTFLWYCVWLLDIGKWSRKQMYPFGLLSNLKKKIHGNQIVTFASSYGTILLTWKFWNGCNSYKRYTERSNSIVAIIFYYVISLFCFFFEKFEKQVFFWKERPFMQMSLSEIILYKKAIRISQMTIFYIGLSRYNLFHFLTLKGNQILKIQIWYLRYKNIKYLRSLKYSWMEKLPPKFCKSTMNLRRSNSFLKSFANVACSEEYRIAARPNPSHGYEGICALVALKNCNKHIL
jgi:hypothetical protein